MLIAAGFRKLGEPARREAECARGVMSMFLPSATYIQTESRAGRDTEIPHTSKHEHGVLPAVLNDCSRSIRALLHSLPVACVEGTNKVRVGHTSACVPKTLHGFGSSTINGEARNSTTVGRSHT